MSEERKSENIKAPGWILESFSSTDRKYEINLTNTY